MKTFDELVASLRAEADIYAGVGGLVDGQKLCLRVAKQIEAAHREWLWGILTPTQAAEERGVHPSTIYRYLKSKKLPNVGREGHPRVRRADLFGDGKTTTDSIADEILNG